MKRNVQKFYIYGLEKAAVDDGIWTEDIAIVRINLVMDTLVEMTIGRMKKASVSKKFNLTWRVKSLLS